MALKKTFSYQTRMFFIVNVFLWILFFVFVTIQYSREREYQVEKLDTRLQVYNTMLLEAYAENGLKLDSALTHSLAADSVRITILDHKGVVLFDTSSDQEDKLSNHGTRHEIVQAMEKGHGYTIRRQSEADNQEYFYSATAGDKIVVRTAVPYGVTLTEVLQGDFGFVWVVLCVTLIINIILFFAIRRNSLAVTNLRDFANAAKDGNILDYDTSSFSDDELGEVSSVIINMYKDLKQTAIERDKSLQETLFEEKEKIRIKHQLTSNINHELKTPVQAIRGCFETLLNNNLDAETTHRLLESGYNNTMRLNDLLQDVALITRITDAKSTLEVAEVNVANVIKEICEEVDSYSVEEKMRINVAVPDNVVIKGNKQLIDAIFRNLVNNSIQYSGGRDIFITLKDESDEFYWFDYYDNGTGVADEHLSKIFERFYRIDSGRSRKSGGTGLGLSIVRNSVLFHNGEITAQNRKFAGLEFIFSLHK